MSDLRPAPGDIGLAEKSVLRQAGCGPGGRWQQAVQQAIAEARSLLEPRGRFLELPYVDDLLDENLTPVAAVARQGRVWSFLVTVGPRLEHRVRSYFEEGHYLEGLLLDACGSVAVEGLCDLLEQAIPGADGQTGTARFSPGYCGWPLAVQPHLLAPLHPEELGVSLQPSCLMTPLKSVSGIVVRGAPESLKVDPEACARCEAIGCVRRPAARKG